MDNVSELDILTAFSPSISLDKDQNDLLGVSGKQGKTGSEDLS